MNIENINRLPVITWRHLKINDTALENLPQSVSKQNLPDFSLFPGIHSVNHKSEFDEIETGMGKETEAYTHAVANERKNLAVIDKIKKPIFYSYSLDKNLPAVVNTHEIIAEENSSSTFLFNYNSIDGSAVFHAGTTKIYAKAGSATKLIYVQTLNDESLAWENIGIEIEQNAKVEIIQVLLGGNRTLSGIKAKLKGQKSEFKIKSVYFGTNSQNIDLNYVAEHIGRETFTEILVDGALANSAVKTLRSTIDFKSGAKHSVGRESEDVLIFSPTARNRTVPLILCSEEDVEGQHAASVGKVDQDKLFYLQSRGLSEIDAKKLLLEAKFAPAVEEIPDKEICDRVRAYLERSVEINAESI